MNIEHKKCKVCGKIFSRKKKVAIKQFKLQKFCSNECFNKIRQEIGFGKWNFGKKRTEKFKKVMSDLKKGRKPYLMTKEIREHMSVASSRRNRDNGCGFQKGNKVWQSPNAIKNRFKKGDNSESKNPAWKGGVTPEHIRQRVSNEYAAWRIKVYKRDNYACKRCGKCGGDLNAHHIKSFSENIRLRLDARNGITFCGKCHRIFHKKYGYKGIGLKELNKFICTM